MASSREPVALFSSAEIEDLLSVIIQAADKMVKKYSEEGKTGLGITRAQRALDIAQYLSGLPNTSFRTERAQLLAIAILENRDGSRLNTVLNDLILWNNPYGNTITQVLECPTSFIREHLKAAIKDLNTKDPPTFQFNLWIPEEGHQDLLSLGNLSQAIRTAAKNALRHYEQQNRKTCQGVQRSHRALALLHKIGSPMSADEQYYQMSALALSIVFLPNSHILNAYLAQELFKIIDVPPSSAVPHSLMSEEVDGVFLPMETLMQACPCAEQLMQACTLKNAIEDYPLTIKEYMALLHTNKLLSDLTIFQPSDRMANNPLTAPPFPSKVPPSLINGN